MPKKVTMLVNAQADEYRAGAIYGALAYNAIHGLQSDDISEHDAFKRYGRAWVEDRVERGQIHFSRVGKHEKSKKNYSIFEIETLRRAEKHIQNIYQSQLHQQL